MKLFNKIKANKQKLKDFSIVLIIFSLLFICCAILFFILCSNKINNEEILPFILFLILGLIFGGLGIAGICIGISTFITSIAMISSKENVNSINSAINTSNVTLCTKCGKEIKLDEEFCSHCSKKIRKD